MRNAIYSLIALVVLSVASQTSASILGGLVTGGLNTINDTNGDRYIPVAGGGAIFKMGDKFESVLVFDNITNANFFNTGLNDASFNPNYRLQAFASATISKVPTPGLPGTVNLSFDARIDVYETTLLANHVNFLADTFLAAMGKVTSSTPLISFASDFLQQPNAPLGVAGVPSFPGLIGDGGFHIIAGTNVANLGIQPNGTSTSYVDVSDGLFKTTFHDLVARIQLFKNTGGNRGPAGFPLLSDTTVQFTIVPEPVSVLCWVGVFGGLAVAVAVRRTRCTASC